MDYVSKGELRQERGERNFALQLQKKALVERAIKKFVKKKQEFFQPLPDRKEN